MSFLTLRFNFIIFGAAIFVNSVSNSNSTFKIIITDAKVRKNCVISKYLRTGCVWNKSMIEWHYIKRAKSINLRILTAAFNFSVLSSSSIVNSSRFQPVPTLAAVFGPLGISPENHRQNDVSP